MKTVVEEEGKEKEGKLIESGATVNIREKEEEEEEEERWLRSAG
jgi:hypothetical protein